MESGRKLIVNGNVVFPDRVSQVSLLVEQGKIKGILEKGMLPQGDCQVIDAGGKMVMAGMVDTHNHMGDPGPYNFREDWYHGSCIRRHYHHLRYASSLRAGYHQPGRVYEEKGKGPGRIRGGFCFLGRPYPFRHQGYGRASPAGLCGV